MSKGKIFVSAALCLSLLATGTSGALAATPDPQIYDQDYQIMPRYETINFATTKLKDLGDGTVGIYVTANGTQSVTEIEIESVLQKKTLFWWSDVETFSKSVYDYDIVMNETTSVDAGTYRVHSTFTFQSSQGTETHENDSSEVTVK